MLWSARALTPSWPGRIGIPRPAIWTCYSSNSIKVASSFQTSSLPSGLGSWSGVLRSRGVHHGPQPFGVGGIGSWAIRHGSTRETGRWHQELMLKGTATCEHRDPWWDGWRVTRPSIFQARVSCVGCCTRNICGDCFGALCPDCELEAARQGIPAVCCAEMQIGEAFRYPMPPLGPGQSEVDVFRAIMGLPPRSS